MIIRLSTFLFCVLCFVGIEAQTRSIKSLVVDEANQPISYANVMFYDNDSTIVKACITDANGIFDIKIDSTATILKISRIGNITGIYHKPFQQKYILKTDNMFLDDVVVTGRASLIKQTETGLIYELGNNKYAKNQNLLQAMRFVPMLDVSSAGGLSVVGGKKYHIYLNGKRYDMAENNTTQVLQTISASMVKHIELVTTPDNRFANDDAIVINITTKEKFLDGMLINVSGNGTTQPTAKAGTSILGKRGSVDFSLAYNYDWNTQRSQPISQKYIYHGYSISLNGKGDGDWHNHITRGMLSWQIDSLNIIYADVHTKILKTDFTTNWTQYTELNDAKSEVSLFENKNDNTSGTIESNFIYRNYNALNIERLTLGYRYSYNPDKRHYTQVWHSAVSNNNMHTYTKTDGGMYEHTMNIAYSNILRSKYKMTVGAKSIWRKGETESTESSNMSYKQLLALPYIKFYGSVIGINISANLNGEYLYQSMHVTTPDEIETSNTKLYFTPSIGLSRNFKGWQLSTNYARTTHRPSITMLNPFVAILNGNASSVGNPRLKAEVKNSVSLNMSKFSQGFFYNVGINYSQTNDAILVRYDNEDVVISSYDNIGIVRTFTGNMFIQWQPLSALVLKCSANGGYYNLEAGDMKQTDYTLNIFGWIDYYMPRSWNVGANVMHFKQVPEPHSTINTITQYSLHIGKTWLGGRLMANAEVKTPFQKYIDMKIETKMNDFSINKTNSMVARSIGVNVSYTFNKGSKVNLTRDKTVKYTDQQTGVE